MKVLLILAAEPEFAPGNADDCGHEYSIPIGAPPLTLAVLAGICQRAGHDVELIDTRYFMAPRNGGWLLDVAALSRRIAVSPAPVAAISFLSSSAKEGLLLGRLCRDQGKKVIAGGLHVSVASAELQRTGLFDYLVAGEAEKALPELLAELEAGRLSRRSRIAEVRVAPTVQDMELIAPVTELSFYQPVFDQYRHPPGHRVVFVETMRGCNHRCEFCEVSINGKAWRMPRPIPLPTVCRSIDYAVSEHDANYLLIADSIATLFKPHFTRVMSHIRTCHPTLNVQFNSTVDCWDRERAEACLGLRCAVYFGFETGSQRMLDLIQKGTTVEQAYSAARLCRELGITCYFNVLLGVPDETQDDRDETMKVLDDLPWVVPNPNLFNPLPGTPLHDKSRRKGEVADPTDYSIWDSERIREYGKGPISTIDYGPVLEHYDRIMRLQALRDPMLREKRPRVPIREPTSLGGSL